MNTGWLIVGGLIGFFIARFVRADADAKGTADSLKARINERRTAALWVAALIGGVIVFFYSKGSIS